MTQIKYPTERKLSDEAIFFISNMIDHRPFYSGAIVRSEIFRKIQLNVSIPHRRVENFFRI